MDFFMIQFIDYSNSMFTFKYFIYTHKHLVCLCLYLYVLMFSIEGGFLLLVVDSRVDGT